MTQILNATRYSNSQNDIPVLYQDGKETELACQTRWANSHCQTTWSTPPTWTCLRNTWIKQICLGRQYIFSQAFHNNILTFGCAWADQTVFQILLITQLARGRRRSKVLALLSLRKWQTLVTVNFPCFEPVYIRISFSLVPLKGICWIRSTSLASRKKNVL